jgi:hypothetical protein
MTLNQLTLNQLTLDFAVQRSAGGRPRPPSQVSTVDGLV